MKIQQILTGFLLFLGILPSILAQEFIEKPNPHPTEGPRSLKYLKVDTAFYLQPTLYKGFIIIQLYDPKNKNKWAPPLMDTSVQSSPFGPRWGRFHHGVDLVLPKGSPVFAVFDGVVEKSSFEMGYGNYIDIKHYNGLTTRYGHLSARVRVGEAVKAGQLIGLVGNTGYSTGDHLHFEVRFQGQALDPKRVFDFSRKTKQIRRDKLLLNARHFKPQIWGGK